MKMKCISLVELWNYLQGKSTANGAEIYVTSENENWDGSWPAPNEEALADAYFDLKKNRVLLCMDGEECECKFDQDKNVYVCHNVDSDASFILTVEEFGICTFQ